MTTRRTYPDPDRAVLLDNRMRERLGTSLRHVLGEAAEPLAPSRYLSP